MTAIAISIGGNSLPATLGDGPAARKLADALPLTLSLARWGDEYYGALPVKLPAGEPRRDVFEVGELALWPDGNAFCVFFGPTPASRGTEPRMASPGVPLGRITADAALLRSQGPALRVSLARVD